MNGPEMWRAQTICAPLALMASQVGGPISRFTRSLGYIEIRILARARRSSLVPLGADSPECKHSGGESIGSEEEEEEEVVGASGVHN